MEKKLEEEIQNLNTLSITERYSIRYGEVYMVAYSGVDPFLEKNKKILQNFLDLDDPVMVAMFSEMAEEILDQLKTVSIMPSYEGPGIKDDIREKAKADAENLIAVAMDLKNTYTQSGPEAVKDGIAAILRSKIEKLEKDNMKLVEKIDYIKSVVFPNEFKNPLLKLNLQVLRTEEKIAQLKEKLKTVQLYETEEAQPVVHDIYRRR